MHFSTVRDASNKSVNQKRNLRNSIETKRQARHLASVPPKTRLLTVKPKSDIQPENSKF